MRRSPGGVPESGEDMAEVLLFHHALGLTPGHQRVRRRAAGGRAHRPHARPVRRADVRRRSRTGVAFIDESRLRATSSSGASGPPTTCPPTSSTRASRSACCRPRSSPRPGPGPAARCCSTPASRSPASGPSGPGRTGVPVQIHGMDADPIFVGEGDVDAARELVAIDRRRRAVPLPGRPALLRRRDAAVVRRGRGGAAQGAGVGVPPGPLRSPAACARRRAGAGSPRRSVRPAGEAADRAGRDVRGGVELEEARAAVRRAEDAAGVGGRDGRRTAAHPADRPGAGRGRLGHGSGKHGFLGVLGRRTDSVSGAVPVGRSAAQVRRTEAGLVVGR